MTDDKEKTCAWCGGKEATAGFYALVFDDASHSRGGCMGWFCSRECLSGYGEAMAAKEAATVPRSVPFAVFEEEPSE